MQKGVSIMLFMEKENCTFGSFFTKRITGGFGNK